MDEKNSKYSCKCFIHFIGSSCQTDSRPCSKYPCLNNGTCLNTNINETEFECKCKNNFYGLYCENKIDLCQNQTCSNNGRCIMNNSLTTCKCNNGFNGDNCELENESIKILRGIRIVSLLICAITIGLTVFLIIFNDCWNYLIKSKKRSKKFQSMKIYRLTYKAK